MSGLMPEDQKTDSESIAGVKVLYVYLSLGTSIQYLFFSFLCMDPFNLLILTHPQTPVCPKIREGEADGKS